MKNKETLLKAIIILFTLALAVTLGVYMIHNTPMWIIFIIGGFLIVLHSIVLPLIKGISESFSGVPMSLIKELNKLGFAPSKHGARITYPEAFNWLRKEKNIYVYPARYTDISDDEDTSFTFEIWHEQGPHWDMEESSGYYSDWDEMEEEALTKAIKLTNKTK